MTLLARLRSWIVASVRRRHFERAMDEEMKTHLALYEADLRSRGLSAAEAARRARAEFGSAEARKDECRDALGLRLIDEVRSDIIYGVRVLRRSRAFTIVALLSLALGIGANTAIFTLIDAVMLETLPVEQPNRLFFIDNSGGRSGGSSGPPYPCFERLRDYNRFFSGMAAFKETRFKVAIDGPPEQIGGQYASGDYFNVLGVPAVLGRVLTGADETDPGDGSGAAVISHGLWKRRFAMDPAVLGRRMSVGTHAVTIVGVTPPGFFGLQVGSPVDITVPMRLSGNSLRSRELWWFSVVGRLRPDAAIEQARADLDVLFDAYMTDLGKPRARRGYFSGIELVPAAKGLNDLRRRFSEPLLIVMAIVAAVLLMGSANVANLLLARASARGTEMSVRLALGATRGRLVRQLFTEGAVLAVLGAMAGLAFARWGISFLLGIIFPNSPDGLPLNPPLSARVLAFTAAIALLTAILFSLAPAFRATRVDAALPASDRTTTSSKPRVRVGRWLVAVQVMLAVMLLCGAAMFLRTLHELRAVDPGFRREGVLTMLVEATVPNRNLDPRVADEHRREHARLGAIWERFIERVAALPGVRSAAAATMSPLSGRDRGVVIAIIGEPPLPEPMRGIHVNQITAGYFATTGIDVIAGRGFTAHDRAGSAPVAILNDAAARAYFGSDSPIGRRVNLPGQRVQDEYEIVGIARDVRYESLRTAAERMIYLPIEQSIDPITTAVVAVRGAGDVTLLVPEIRDVVRDAVPAGFVTGVVTIEQRVAASLVRERLLSLLATFFGGLALVLASIGLYGVMAYGVVRRKREIGIRLAIGATRGEVIWMIVREMLAVTIAGAALGGVAAAIAMRYVKSQLFGVEPGDPYALFTAIALLLAVAAIAAYLPARRASRIDPAIALRYE